MEEIYQKLEAWQRRQLANWVRGVAPAWLRRPKEDDVAGADGRPDTWQLRTRDTFRWAPFRFRGVLVHHLPPLADKDALFRRALSSALSGPRAIAVNVLLAPYERFVGDALCFIVDADFAALRALVSAQVAMDAAELAGDSDAQVADIAAAARAVWRGRGLPDALYRSTCLALLAARSQSDDELPFVWLHPARSDSDDVSASSEDGAPSRPPRALLLWFRDAEELDPTLHEPLMRAVAAAPDGRVDDEPLVVRWPLRAHAASTHRPEALCNAPGCSRGTGRPPLDAPAASSFDAHLGPVERARDLAVRKRLVARWNDVWEPRYEAELEALRVAGNYSDEADAAALRAVQDEMDRDDEPRARAAVLAESTSALRLCTRCHVAAYCSSECQRKDWPKHKSICWA